MTESQVTLIQFIVAGHILRHPEMDRLSVEEAFDALHELQAMATPKSPAP